MHPTLYTIGYEGATTAEFLAGLKRAGVAVLLDIRAIAWSRKPGFSAEPLRRLMEENGIAYRQIEALGNPQKRDGKPDGDTRSYEEMYEAHLNTEAARDALTLAARIAREAPACLLCFERNPDECHRRLTAPHIAAITGQRIEHLFPQKKTDQLSLL
jgi:uncharacterized protein (DUF488 family)